MSAQKVVSWLLQRYWRLSRGLTLAVAGVVLDEGGRVLLVRDTPQGPWRLPGGLALRTERAGEALRRRLASDAAITTEKPPRLLALDKGHARATGDHVAVYLIEAWERRSGADALHGAAETGFFGLGELPSGLDVGLRERLAHLARRHGATIVSDPGAPAPTAE